MNNNIQTILQVLPDSTKKNHDLIEITENYVVLSSTPKTLIFQFDQVLNANTDQELYDDYFYNYMPNSTLHELLKGNDISFIIYNEKNNQDSFAIKLIEAYTNLLESNINPLDISISFFEFNHSSQRDLITLSSNQMHEYSIQTLEQLKTYYSLGQSQHKGSHMSVFSIRIKSKEQENHIHMIDITNDTTDILDQVSDCLYFSPKSIVEKSPLLRTLSHSQCLYFIASIDLNDPHLQQKLAFTSSINQKLKKKSVHVPKHDIKQVMPRISYQVHSLRNSAKLSQSGSTMSYHDSVFSGTFTQSTRHTSFSDKEQQLEQACVEMRETNMELWVMNEKQAALIVLLESQVAKMQVDFVESVHSLRLEKEQLLKEMKRMTVEPVQQQIRTQRQITHLKQQLDFHKQLKQDLVHEFPSPPPLHYQTLRDCQNKLARSERQVQALLEQQIKKKKNRFFCF